MIPLQPFMYVIKCINQKQFMMWSCKLKIAQTKMFSCKINDKALK